MAPATEAIRWVEVEEERSGESARESSRQCVLRAKDKRAVREEAKQSKFDFKI